MSTISDIQLPAHLPAEEIRRGKAFGLWIRKSLALKGWSQKRLAEASGLSPMTVSVYCRDGYDPQTEKIRRPEPETIEKVAIVLETSENDGRIAAGYSSRRAGISIDDRTISESTPIPHTLRILADQLERAVPGNQAVAERLNAALDSIGRSVDTAPFETAFESVQPVGASGGRLISIDAPVEPLALGEFIVKQIHGNCMEPLLHEGDMAIITEPHTVRDGDTVIALVDMGTITCKRISIPGDGQPSYLEPLNGEGIIDESRFLVAGVVKHAIEPMARRMERLKAGQR